MNSEDSGEVEDQSASQNNESDITSSQNDSSQSEPLQDIQSQQVVIDYENAFTVDIRSDNNSPSQTEGLGLTYNYFHTTAQYDRILNNGFKEQVTNNYKVIFALLANENNYPMYIHCTAGADRTGTLSFLINGYLGVPSSDLESMKAIMLG